MQEWRPLLGGNELRLQLFPPCSIPFSSSFTTDARNALHRHLDQLLARGVELSDLPRCRPEARAMLPPKPVHLARELFAELVEEVLTQELLLDGPLASPAGSNH
jgi:hypothetical protein